MNTAVAALQASRTPYHCCSEPEAQGSMSAIFEQLYRGTGFLGLLSAARGMPMGTMRLQMGCPSRTQGRTHAGGKAWEPGIYMTWSSAQA